MKQTLLFLIFPLILILAACSPINNPTPRSLFPPSTYTAPSVSSPKAPTEQGNNVRNILYPFDLKVDTISYMNCPGHKNIHDPNFFTFQFNSNYEGISFDPAFLDGINPYTAANFQKNVRDSPHLASRPQMHISQRDNPKLKFNFQDKGGNGIAYFDQGSLLNHPYFLNNMTSQYKSLQISPNTPLKAFYPATGASLPSFLTYLRNTHAFTLSYAPGATPEQLISLNPSAFYGRTYTPAFSGGEDEDSFLTEITEENLINRKQEGRWTCSKSLRFLIHRHPGYTRYIYEDDVRQALDNDSKGWFEENELTREADCVENDKIISRTNLEIVKHVLIGGNFKIGETEIYDLNGNRRRTGKPCIVPTHSQYSCYAGTGITRIEFDDSEDCSVYDREKRACPSYLSICIRR